VRIGLIAFTTLALLAVRPAEAQTQQADGTWYGWQIALVDVAAVGSIVAWTKVSSGKSSADATHAPPVLALGALTFVLGGPIIHSAVHHNPAAGRSLILRLLLPLGAGLIGGYVGGHGVGAAVGGAYGLALGGVAAMAIDWTSAREPTPAVSLRASPGTITLALRF
jgi:hypothetical protein